MPDVVSGGDLIDFQAFLEAHVREGKERISTMLLPTRIEQEEMERFTLLRAVSSGLHQRLVQFFVDFRTDQATVLDKRREKKRLHEEVERRNNNGEICRYYLQDNALTATYWLQDNHKGYPTILVEQKEPAEEYLPFTLAQVPNLTGVAREHFLELLGRITRMKDRGLLLDLRKPDIFFMDSKEGKFLVKVSAPLLAMGDVHSTGQRYFVVQTCSNDREKQPKETCDEVQGKRESEEILTSLLELLESEVQA